MVQHFLTFTQTSRLRRIREVTERSQQTLAYLFSPDLQEVLLIKISKPGWQQGKYNGIGGKIQQGENKDVACCRELLEESGYQATPDELVNFGELIGDNWQVHTFALHAKEKIMPFKSNEGTTEWVRVDHLPMSCIDNLAWMVPCARLHLSHPHQPYLTAQYPSHNLKERKELA